MTLLPAVNNCLLSAAPLALERSSSSKTATALDGPQPRMVLCLQPRQAGSFPGVAVPALLDGHAGGRALCRPTSGWLDPELGLSLGGSIPKSSWLTFKVCVICIISLFIKMVPVRCN